MRRPKVRLVAALTLLAVGWPMNAQLALAEPPQVLIHAHAHNDYHHARPLIDALDHGFASIEADVFLVDGQLLVGHDPAELQPERTLESLYLKPLQERVDANDGSVYGDGTELALLVDIKSDGPKTYAAIAQLLAEYANILTNVSDGRVRPAAIRVVISGNRPIEMIAAENPRYATIDGRFPELDGELSAHLVPLVSENWRSHFTWNGKGEMPMAERKKLREFAASCHIQNRRLRFWATPETPECWSELLSADVDLIGTDNLDALQDFLSSQPAGDKSDSPNK